MDMLGTKLFKSQERYFAMEIYKAADALSPSKRRSEVFRADP